MENSLGYLYPESIDEWHPAKNGDLTPHGVSRGSGEKFWFIIKSGRHRGDSLIETYTTPSSRRATYENRRKKSKDEMEND